LKKYATIHHKLATKEKEAKPHLQVQTCGDKGKATAFLAGGHGGVKLLARTGPGAGEGGKTTPRTGKVSRNITPPTLTNCLRI